MRIGRRAPEMLVAQTVYSTDDAPRAIRRMLVPKEHVIFATRKHVAPLIEPVASVVIGLLLVLYIAIRLEGDGGTMLNLLWIGWLVLLLRAIDKVWLWWDEWLALTTGRLIMVYGTIDRKVTIRPLTKIHEWSLTRPLLGQFLGFGHIEMRAHDDVNMKVVRFVPRPTELYSLIDRELLNRQASGSGTYGSKQDPWQDIPEKIGRRFLPARRRTTEQIPLVRAKGRPRARAFVGRRPLQDEDDVVQDHRDYFSRQPDLYDDDDDIVELSPVHGRSDEGAEDPIRTFGYDYDDDDDDYDVDVHGYDGDAEHWTDVHGSDDDNDDPIQVHGREHEYPDDDDLDDSSNT